MSDQLDILNNEFIKLYNYVLLSYEKRNSFVNKNLKKYFKIIKYSSDWKYKEVLTNISRLNPKQYRDLFVFVIEVNDVIIHNESLPEEINTALLKFSKTRPIVVQLTSVNENVTKLFYKVANSNELCIINQQQNGRQGQCTDFSTFLLSLMKRGINQFIEDLKITENGKIIPDDHKYLIIKFISILDLPDESLESLLFACAANGSKDHLLALFDTPFEFQNKILNNYARYNLSNAFPVRVASNPASEDNQGDASEPKNEPVLRSVLSVAVDSKNNEITKFLIDNYTELIQELPFKNKVYISTALFRLKNIEYLCDLLEFADFPFPENFQDDSTADKRLLDIVDSRNKFHLAVLSKISEISKIVEDNLNLKFMYSIDNQSALYKALSNKKYDMYFYLKSFCYRAHEMENHEEFLKDNEAELKKAKSVAWRWTKKNIKKTLPDKQKPVNSLLMKSHIQNRKINEAREKIYRSKIKEWLLSIFSTKFGPQLLGVAAQCENLKIIFDFDSYSVSN